MDSTHFRSAVSPETQALTADILAFFAQSSNNVAEPPLPPLTSTKRGVSNFQFPQQQSLQATSLASLTTAPPPLQPSSRIHRRIPTTQNNRLLVTVRILMMDLERSREHHLKARVKTIIRDCNRCHKRGDAGFSPLNQAIEALVKATVGESRWAQATHRLDVMLLQRKQRYLS